MCCDCCGEGSAAGSRKTQEAFPASGIVRLPSPERSCRAARDASAEAALSAVAGARIGPSLALLHRWPHARRRGRAVAGIAPAGCGNCVRETNPEALHGSTGPDHARGGVRRPHVAPRDCGTTATVPTSLCATARAIAADGHDEDREGRHRRRPDADTGVVGTAIDPVRIFGDPEGTTRRRARPVTSSAPPPWGRVHGSPARASTSQSRAPCPVCDRCESGMRRDTASPSTSPFMNPMRPTRPACTTHSSPAVVA